MKLTSIMLCVFSMVAMISGGDNHTTNSIKNTRPDIEITPGGTAPELWKIFCTQPNHPGITNLKVTSTSDFANKPDYEMWGSYKKCPPISGVNMKDGVIMTSGLAKSAVGPNTSKYTTYMGGGLNGDDDLQDIVGRVTWDAPRFTVSFTSDETVKGFQFKFCFGTEEFDEYVNNKYNDAFVCLLDGKNIAEDNLGNIISVNSAFFGVENLENQINLEYDGFTYVLRCSKPLEPGDHTIKFVIGDVQDSRYDCAVFLSDFKWELGDTNITPDVNIIEDQTFQISQNTQPQELVGTIQKLCKYNAITTKENPNVNEFFLNSFDIRVDNGAQFDITQQDTYILPVIATLDTTWQNKPWKVHDTATMTIKIINGDEWPPLEESTIFDQDGDGVGDSISINLKYPFPDKYTLKTGDFSWPTNDIDYSENLSNTNLSTDKKVVSFSYNPGNGSKVWTKGTSKIDLTIDSSGTDSKHSGALEDGIGPVLMEAQVVKRYIPENDTFRVIISEPVNIDDIKGMSFILLKGSATGREISIEPLNKVKDLTGGKYHIEFLVKDLGVDAPKSGDWLKILSSGPILDNKKNKSHKDNRPVPIEFTNGSLNTWPEIDYSYIYDRDGNGIADSIKMKFKGSFIDSMIPEKVTFSWPKNIFTYTKDIKDSHKFNNNTIAFSFTPDNGATMMTDGKSSITLSLDSLGTTIKRKATLNERIGTVLTEAFAVKKYTPKDDTFYVKLSESVKVSDISGKSFILLKGGKTGKEVSLSPIGSVKDVDSDGTYIRFSVKDLGSETPQYGDWIKIKHNGSVEDLLNNKPHKNNPPVPLQFLNTDVPLKSALYEDTNGNGIIDNIDLIFYDTLETTVFKKLQFDVLWTGVTVKDVPAKLIGNDQMKVELDVEKLLKKNSVTHNKTSGEMVIYIHYKDEKITFNDVQDKASPVITRAIYKPSSFTRGKKGELSITFSEEVKRISSSKPFTLLSHDKSKEFSFTLENHLQNNVDGNFVVTEINEIKTPERGDSIWINYKKDVQDIFNNTQDVKNNKKVPLEIIYPPFTLTPHAIGPHKPRAKLSKELQGSMKYGTAIVLIPNQYIPLKILKQVHCNLTIYDPLGNTIASSIDGKEIISSTEKSIKSNNIILMNWSDTNGNKRIIGSTVYLGVVEISYPHGVVESKSFYITFEQ